MDSTIGSEIFNKDKNTGYDSDFLDDSALIEAFDNAVNPIKASLGDSSRPAGAVLDSSQRRHAHNHQQKPSSQMKKKKHKKNNQKTKHNVGSVVACRAAKWKVGSRCRAVFSEDGLAYDAVIIELDTEAGTCTVRYDYYNNEEVQQLSDLMAATGDCNESMQNHCGSNITSDLDSAIDGAESDQSSQVLNGFARPHPHHRHHRAQKPRFDRPSPRNRGGRHSMPPFVPPTFPMPGMPPFPFAGRVPAFAGHRPNGSFPVGVPLIPPPPPPPVMADSASDCEKEALYSMLISWYMSGYHTGYYQGLKERHEKNDVTEDESGTTSADHDESCHHGGGH